MRFCMIAFIVAATGCAGSLSFNPLASTGSRGSTTSSRQSVPQVVGQPQGVARDRLAARGITRVRWLTHRCSNGRIPVGSVCSTMPRAHSQASANTRVTVWVQAAPRKRVKRRNQRDLDAIRKAKGSDSDDDSMSDNDDTTKSADTTKPVEDKKMATGDKTGTATAKPADSKPKVEQKPAKKDYF